MQKPFEMQLGKRRKNRESSKHWYVCNNFHLVNCGISNYFLISILEARREIDDKIGQKMK
jgi:hypothetical protein